MATMNISVWCGVCPLFGGGFFYMYTIPLGGATPPDSGATPPPSRGGLSNTPLGVSPDAIGSAGGCAIASQGGYCKLRAKEKNVFSGEYRLDIPIYYCIIGAYEGQTTHYTEEKNDGTNVVGT